MALAPDDPRHGTLGGYKEHKCRCEPCRAANREYQRKWREANPEKNREHGRESSRKHREANPERQRMKVQASLARKKGVTTGDLFDIDLATDWLIELLTLCRRCPGCAREFGNDLPTEIDHIIPLDDVENSSHDSGNTWLLCKPCNVKKSNRSLDKWLDSRTA